MKLTFACNLEWVAGNTNADRIIIDFKAVGFEFKVRRVPNGAIASVVRPVEVELNTVDELIELQRKLGFPIRIEDGHLEVVS